MSVKRNLLFHLEMREIRKLFFFQTKTEIFKFLPWKRWSPQPHCCMSPAESLLCFAEQPQGWGDPLFSLCAPANPSGTRLCAKLLGKLLVAVLLPTYFQKLRDVRFPHSANMCGNSLTVLAIRDLVFRLKRPWCLMEAVYIAELSCLFSILQIHAVFSSPWLPLGAAVWDGVCVPEANLHYTRDEKAFKTELNFPS